MDDLEKMCNKIERRIFKLECKIEAINDELYHIELIKVDHNGKLNKKRSYRKMHLEKVLNYYYDQIKELNQELDFNKRELKRMMKNNDEE